MKRLVVLSVLTLAMFFLAFDTAAAARPPRCSCPANTVAAATPELAPVFAADLAVEPGAVPMTSVPAARPPEDCPGEFDTSRLANFEDCTLAACNQWCIEDGGNFAVFEIWILPGICACKCCV